MFIASGLTKNERGLTEEVSLKRSVRFSGCGYPSCSRELAKTPPNTRDGSGFYALLEVPPWATEQEIKKSYRRLSRKYHPDGYAPDEKRFSRIAFAYDVLMNRRHEYNLTARGRRWLFPDEVQVVDREKASKKEKRLEFSYIYEEVEAPLLAREWYRALMETLPSWGYRGRIVLKLGTEVRASLGIFEVPYVSPSDSLLLILGLQSVTP